MKNTKFYRQCTLIKPTEVGKVERTTWLPECFAILGDVLSLRDEGAWSVGWIVKFVGSPLSAEIVERNSRDYLRQRNHSDVIFSDIKKQNERF